MNVMKNYDDNGLVDMSPNLSQKRNIFTKTPKQTMDETALIN
jgi:hypothetical protein